MKNLIYIILIYVYYTEYIKYYYKFHFLFLNYIKYDNISRLLLFFSSKIYLNIFLYVISAGSGK